MKTCNYHDGARGPALCVKVYNVDSALPKDCNATEEQRTAAYEETQREFWEAAGHTARDHGFRDVFSAGRMGGWLYTSPLPAEKEDGGAGEYPPAFVDAIAALLASVPQSFAHHLAHVLESDADAAEEAAEAQAAEDARAAYAASVEALAPRLADALRGIIDARDASRTGAAFMVRAESSITAARAVLAEFDALQGKGNAHG